MVIFNPRLSDYLCNYSIVVPQPMGGHRSTVGKGNRFTTPRRVLMNGINLISFTRFWNEWKTFVQSRSVNEGNLIPYCLVQSVARPGLVPGWPLLLLYYCLWLELSIGSFARFIYLGWTSRRLSQQGRPLIGLMSPKEWFLSGFHVFYDFDLSQRSSHPMANQSP